MFDYQTALAAQFGDATRRTRRASEALMQRYYRAAKAVTQLNTILLQNLRRASCRSRTTAPRALNERFRMRGELLEAADEDLFEREPTRHPGELPADAAAPASCAA